MIEVNAFAFGYNKAIIYVHCLFIYLFAIVMFNVEISTVARHFLYEKDCC